MTNWEWLLEMGKERPDELAAWLSATRGGLDAPKEEDGGNDEFPPENVVSVAERARNANKAAQVVPEEHVRDSTKTMPDNREQLEADIAETIDFWGAAYPDARVHTVLRWLDRQADITRRTEQAEWIKQANGLIHEANARAAELKAERDEWRTKCETREIAYKQADAERKRYSEQIDELIAERDEAVEAYDAHMAAHDAWHEAEDIKYTRNRFAVYEQVTKERIARLESERNALQAENMSLKANSDECVPRAIKKRDEVIKILESERDEVRHDLEQTEATCMGQRREIEELREKLSAAIGHALEITRLQDLEED